jgi:hypothetical protein
MTDNRFLGAVDERHSGRRDPARFYPAAKVAATPRLEPPARVIATEKRNLS